MPSNPASKPNPCTEGAGAWRSHSGIRRSNITPSCASLYHDLFCFRQGEAFTTEEQGFSPSGPALSFCFKYPYPVRPSKNGGQIVAPHRDAKGSAKPQADAKAGAKGVGLRRALKKTPRLKGAGGHIFKQISQGAHGACGLVFLGLVRCPEAFVCQVEQRGKDREHQNADEACLLARHHFWLGGPHQEG